MSTLDEYKQKIEAELEVAQAKIAELTAKAKDSTADAKIEFSKQIEQLEQGVESAKAKLGELGEAGEEAWEQLKEGAESAWDKLTAAVKETAAKFKD